MSCVKHGNGRPPIQWLQYLHLPENRPRGRAQYLRNPISTICMGQAASMASLLLAAGEAGQRRSLPNTRIMLHQPSGGASVRLWTTGRA